MDINWTTVITSGVVAAIISSMQFITTRYLGRILDRLEKTSERNRLNDNSKP
jgi:hypothetical protein